MTIFYRKIFTEIVVTLKSDETLGILDTGYLEDSDGIDGQLTIRHLATNTKSTLLMVSLDSETPGIAHDMFRGWMQLASLPDGDFQIEGRCRDVVGNYTILSAFGRNTGERIVPLLFTIKPGSELVFGTSTGYFAGVIRTRTHVKRQRPMGKTFRGRSANATP